MKFKSEVQLEALNNATVDTDRFLVSDSGTVKYRTGAEVLSDLGITLNTASRVQHQVKAGVAISKGKAVYVTSADGTNMIVGLASNASEATSSKTMGLLDADAAINGFANVVTEGLLAGLNTVGANAGDPVWLGTNGNLLYGVATKPSAPAHMVFIGIVTRVNANNGEIFVKVQNGFELEELHNVNISGPATGDLLQYNASNSLWQNKSLDLAGIQAKLNGTGFVKASGTTISYDNTTYYPFPTGTTSQYVRGDGTLATFPTGGITGSGTTNYVTKFTGSSTIGNSLIYDNGTAVGIGTTSPISKLQSTGDITVGPGTFSSSGTMQLLTGGASPISNRITYSTDGTGWKFAIGKNQSGTVTDQFVIQDNGRVGIGTESPQARLHVASIDNEVAFQVGESPSSGESGGFFRIEAPTQASASYSNLFYSSISESDGDSFGSVLIYANAEEGIYLNSANSANTEISSIGVQSSGIYLTTSGGVLNLSGTGDVGIGTTGPSYKLDVNGSFRAYAPVVTSNPNVHTGFQPLYFAGAPNTPTTYFQVFSNGNGTDSSQIGIGSNNSIYYRWGTNSWTQIQPALTNPVTGLGTTSYVPKFTGGSAIGDSAIYDNSGKIGIGTTGAVSKFEVLGTNSASPSRANASAYIIGADVGLAVGQYSAGPFGTWMQSLRSTDNLAFPLSINPSGGNVAIGKASPSTALDVNGVITATGGSSTSWNAKQDALVSGTNIRTVNNQTIVGPGNINIGGAHGLVPVPTASGMSYSQSINGGGFSVMGGTANRMYLAPFMPVNAFNSISLSIQVTSAVAGAVIRLLLYSNSAGRPQGKLWESASLDCSTTGVKTAALTTSFTAGSTVWIGVHSSSTASTYALQTTQLVPLYNLTGSQTISSYYLTAAVGSAPATITSGLTGYSAQIPMAVINV